MNVAVGHDDSHDDKALVVVVDRTPIQVVVGHSSFFCLTSYFMNTSIYLTIDVVRQIVAKVRRLVVGSILPSYAHTVCMIMHQCGDGIVGGSPRGIDVYLGRIVQVPQNELLAPITQDVGLQTGRGLGSVA